MLAFVSFFLTCILIEYWPAIIEAPSTTEGPFSDIGDLGTLLLGGFALAVVVGIAFVFVRLRLRERKPPPAQFISISSVEKK